MPRRLSLPRLCDHYIRPGLELSAAQRAQNHAHEVRRSGRERFERSPHPPRSCQICAAATADWLRPTTAHNHRLTAAAPVRHVHSH